MPDEQLYENARDIKQRMLVAGTEKTALSITVCLLRAGHQVTLLNQAGADVLKTINGHISDVHRFTGDCIDMQNLYVINCLDDARGYDIAIAVTKEDDAEKIKLISHLESHLAADVLIAINTESIALSSLQLHTKHPERLIGANWTEPAHTTYFLEIITNAGCRQQLVDDFCQTAKEWWHKNPYIIKSDKGIRARMMCAILREAFYLIENDYVTIEDIDRSLRNDGGYYLPFAGNFRYMDLMGAYMYGIVMQDLNPELSKNTHIPQFCQEIFDNGYQGMAGGKGFYDYGPGEAGQWKEVLCTFSYQIEKIIGKYPFTYKQEAAVNINLVP